ncbi:MAG TPA: hypothetical protein VK116_00575, partial [Planctomycetota bacterium]|nr:hypothetical protein [Planctomycetota bacterium]
PEKVELIAEIGCHRTRLHRAVKPFAGIVREPFPLAPSPREVERVLYLPAKKLDDELFEPRRVVARGQPFDSIGFELDGALVWGLTARVLRAFYVDSPAFRRAIRAAS